MEFLMALPFLFFILILTVNFGRSFLMRQRAIMAVRYIAFAPQHQQAQPTDSEVSQLFFQGQQTQVISPSNEQFNSSSCEQSSNAVSDSSNRDNNGSPILPQVSCSVPDDSGIAGFLNSLGGTKRYVVQHDYRPVFAAGDYWGNTQTAWFPAVTVSSSLAMDSGDWRHDEMSIWKLAGKVGSGAWREAQNVFH